MKKDVICNFDWVELFCDFSEFAPADEVLYLPCDYGTKFFKQKGDLCYQRVPFASVCFEPRSPIIKANTGLVKISNECLYTQHNLLIALQGLEICKIKILSISRLDIAADFQTFANGWSPEEFVQSYLAGGVVMIGAKKIQLNGSCASGFTWNYLSWGSRSSDFRVYLYNKKLELSEKHDKPYIRQRWQEAGFDQATDVWRLEFSLKGKALFWQGEEQPSPVRIQWEDLLLPDFPSLLFGSLYHQRWDIRQPSNDKNRSRWLRLDLFKPENFCVRLVYGIDRKDSTRADKIFLKRLYQINYNQRHTQPDVQEWCENLFDYYQKRTGLSDFVERKKFTWQSEIIENNILL